MNLTKNKKLIIAIFLTIISIIILALIIDKTVWYYKYGSSVDELLKDPGFIEIKDKIKSKGDIIDKSTLMEDVLSGKAAFYTLTSVALALKSNKDFFNAFISGMSLALVVSALASMSMFYVAFSKKHNFNTSDEI